MAEHGLSDTAVNAVENLAIRIAARNGGRVTPAHLAPWTPLSLDMVRAVLDDMVDGHTVVREDDGGFPEYVFTTRAAGTDDGSGPVRFDRCVGCETDLDGGANDPLCPSCHATIEQELAPLAERNAWPADAVWEHELLHIAGATDGPVLAADMAGRSSFTLRRVKKKLRELVKKGYARQELSDGESTVRYHFPAVPYPRERYEHNMNVIRSFPASLMEETEIRLTRIVLAVTGLLVLCLLGAFVRVPPFLLVGGFLVAAPTISYILWKHKDAPPE